MTKTKRSMGKRILSVGLLILTLFALILSLSSCGSDTEKFEKQGKNETNADFVARVIATSNSYKIRFVAAYRGYDITREDFEDSSEIKETPDFDAAKALMQEIIDQKNFDNSDDEATFTTYKNSLTTKASMEAVINSESFKETATLKHSNGFPTILLVWIGKFLGLITKITGGYYVLAIMVFAVIVEVLMLPMSIKQQKNSIGMAKLRPQIAKIEKKYAGRNDQVTLRKKQEEIMALQQKEGFSPFSGCLPLIIQLIIVGFILYPIIQNPLRYVLDQSTGFSSALVSYATAPEAAGGLGLSLSSSGNVIELLASLPKDMSGIKDFALLANGEEIFNTYLGLGTLKFTAFGINLGKVPEIASILVIVPILNLVGQWFTMRLTRKWTGSGYNAMGAADNQEKFSLKMMDVLPLLMTLFIMFQVPAMIGIYWFFRSLVALGKQYIMKIVLPVPKYTEEELREIEKAEKERQKAQKAALKQQPKYRSLHYIDEDDYDELPEVKQNTSGKKISSQDAPEIKD